VALKELGEQPEFKGLDAKALRANELFLDATQKISSRFGARTEELRYQLSKLYEERRRKTLPDYPIFMAIAEDIGYDATGRPTKANELEPIAVELARFLAAIEEGKA
jgi:hypothetical protein